LELVARGQIAPAIEAFRALYGFGADPASVIADLLEHCHAATLAKALGPEALVLPKDQAQRLAAIGAALSAGTLSRLWQMLLKGLEEVRRAPDPAAAAEMILVRLAYAADLPGPEEALKLLSDVPERDAAPEPPRPTGGGGRSGGSAAQALAQPESASAIAPASPRTFDEMIRLIDTRRDIALRLDVEQHLRLISFRPGAIVFEPAAGAPANLAQRLAARLKEWTGRAWLVAAEGGGGAATLAEQRNLALETARAEALADPFVRSVMETFPGTELVDVRLAPAPEAVAPQEEEAEEDP